MTYPGFRAHQAAHQAHQAESLRATQHATHAALRLSREHQQARRTRGAFASSRQGAGSAAIRMIGRLIRIVITLAIVATAVGILAIVLR
jgi:hypothetical protein